MKTIDERMSDTASCSFYFDVRPPAPVQNWKDTVKVTVDCGEIEALKYVVEIIESAMKAAAKDL